MNASMQPAGGALPSDVILDTLPIGVAVLDASGTIRSTNLTMARLLDIDRSELLQQPVYSMLDLSSETLSRALRECELLGEADLPLVHAPDGRPLLLHLTAVFSDGAERRILTATPLPDHAISPHGRPEPPTATATAPPPVSTASEPTPPPPGRSSDRVLLVEDDAVVAMVACGYLEQLNLLVDVATTGAEAIERSTKQSYRWVILDCMLPDTSGRSVFEHLQRLPPPHRPARIIATSGMNAGTLPGEMDGVPVDAILAKPMRPDAIRAALGLDSPEASRQAVDGFQSETTLEPEAAPMPDPETLPVFDPQTVKSLRSQPGGATFVDAVFRAFLSDVGEAHGTLARAFGEQDFRAIGRTAHRIRGAAASVGASQVEQRCVALQQAAEERSVGAIAGHITRFSSEVRAVELALSDFYR